MRWPIPILVISFVSARAAGESGPELEALPEGAAPVPSPSREPEHTPKREEARRWFEAAVSLARAGRYATAKALFLEAHKAEPHPLVLYNIARAELHLGEKASAARHLREFLDQVGVALESTQREAVESQIARIERELAEEPRPAQESQMERDEAVTVTAVSGDSQGAVHAMAMPSSLTSLPPPPQLAGAPEQGTTPPTWSYAVITAGFAVLGNAVALYVWNHDRYQGWHRRNAELIATREDLLAQGRVPAEDAVLRARAGENDALLTSVQRFDSISIIVGGLGVTAIGFGVWTLLDHRDNGKWRLSLTSTGGELHTRFVW